MVHSQNIMNKYVIKFAIVVEMIMKWDLSSNNAMETTTYAIGKTNWVKYILIIVSSKQMY